MPLSIIYNQFASQTGLTASSQRNFCLQFINRAAEDIYTKIDPREALRECVFLMQEQYATVTLPYFVGKIRKIRQYSTGIQANLHDMLPRYHTQGWAELYHYLTWRIKGEIPIGRDIQNEGPLTLALPDGEVIGAGETFSIYITGGNTKRQRFTEQVDFVVGVNSVNTTNLFSTIESISKTAPCNYDVTIDDPDGNELASLPNSLLTTKYTVIQLTDYEPISNYYVEILYKQELLPFFNNFDEFPARGYDQAIFFKALELYYATKEGRETEVILASKKCDALLKQISEDKGDQATTKPLDIAPNSMIEIQQPKFYNYPPEYGIQRW